MKELLLLIWANKEWLFSGVGGTIAAFVIRHFVKEKKAEKQNGINNFGNNVTNMRAETINNTGLGYKDVKNICTDLVKEEIQSYRSEALAVAKKRDEELFDAFSRKLEEAKITEKDVMHEFSNPDMQFTYVEAQKSYIKVGTPELIEILSSLLVDRAKESDHTLLQIVLSEAVRIAPMLLEPQYIILSLVFILRYTIDNSVNSVSMLQHYLDTRVVPLTSILEKKPSYFQHLEYTACANDTFLYNSLVSKFKDAYRGLFFTGICRNAIQMANDGSPLNEAFPELFAPCINDNSKLQLNFINKYALDSRLSDLRYSADREKILTLFDQNIMDDVAIKNMIILISPEMEDLFDYWDNTHIGRLSLTSVGIVIGATYAQQITKEKFDFSIWI